MKVGTLVEMYGEPGFYGIVLGPAKGMVGSIWFVFWQSGYIFPRGEQLLKVIQ